MNTLRIAIVVGALFVSILFFSRIKSTNTYPMPDTRPISGIVVNPLGVATTEAPLK